MPARDASASRARRRREAGRRLPAIAALCPAARRYYDPNAGTYDSETGTWTGGTVYEPFCDGVCSKLNSAAELGGVPCAACTSTAGCTTCPAGSWRIPDCSLNYAYRQFIGGAAACASRCDSCGACQVPSCFRPAVWMSCAWQ